MSIQSSTIKILNQLCIMKKRPTLYFDPHPTYSLLSSFLSGYAYGISIEEEDMIEFHWSEMDTEVETQLRKESNTLSDEECFYRFFEILTTVIKEKYPQYLDI